MIKSEKYYLDLIKKESEQKENIDSYERMDNVSEFINSMKGFDNLEGFLEHISLVLENENLNEKNKISLMTIHSAKGLEFDNVFLIGWEEGLFPSKRSIEEKGIKGLEEERRLAYVALTRAKKKVSISFVNQNRYAYASHDFNAPSAPLKTNNSEPCKSTIQWSYSSGEMLFIFKIVSNLNIFNLIFFFINTLRPSQPFSITSLVKLNREELAASLAEIKKSLSILS